MFCWFKTHWFCVFDGSDEEMILIGMATRRFSPTPTSECIQAAATTDSRTGFQISIPERGVAFQHLLPNSPTRTTGESFCEGERTKCVAGGEGRQIKCKCRHKCKWRRSSKPVAAFKVELVSLYWNVNEMVIYNCFFFLFWLAHLFHLCQQRLAKKLESSAAIYVVTTWWRDNIAYHSFEPLYCSRGFFHYWICSFGDKWKPAVTCFQDLVSVFLSQLFGCYLV